MMACKVKQTSQNENPNLDLATIVTITEENWKQTNGKINL